jgi:hypothetical protein
VGLDITLTDEVVAADEEHGTRRVQKSIQARELRNLDHRSDTET